jgi:hypothetical protein
MTRARGANWNYMHRALSTMTTVLTRATPAFRILDLEPSDGEGFDYDRSHKGVARNPARASANSLRSGLRFTRMLMTRASADRDRIVPIGRYS